MREKPNIDFLGREGPTLELIRSIDWSSTAIGTRERWPQSLRSALSICVNSNFPIAIYWGPQLVLLYNEAWSPIPGNKHPWAFGKPAIEVWPDIWDEIEPQFQKAFYGIPGGSKDALLPMQRHGYTEECYFDFTFTPIYGESGKVEGIFNAVIETTYRIINDRRANVLRRLGDAVRRIQTSADIYQKAANVLNHSRQDVPFFQLYEIVDSNPELRGYSKNLNTTVQWPVREVLETGSLKWIDNLENFIPSLPAGFWPEPTREAVMVPLKRSDGTPFGFIVGGISSRRKLDKDYQSFYDSVSAIISAEWNMLQSLVKERERAESLAQIDKAKTTFFSNISHEFRTPLTLMLGPLEEVLNDSSNLNHYQKSHLETSRRNTLRLQKLVNTLLDFSRIEAGKMDPKFQYVNVAQITKDLASSFRSVIESAGLSYDVSIADIKSQCAIDVDMWEKIVLNLISNAFKYTEQGRIGVQLYESSGSISLKVSDTGIGIGEEHLSRLFDRFYRIGNQDGRSQEGTGIGLAMVRELVQLHEGEITVESKSGVGSTFTVRIPSSPKKFSSGTTPTNGEPRDNKSDKSFVEEASKWTRNAIEEAGNGATANISKPKIVVADDNIDMREYIVRLLEQDFEVITATNGEHAFNMIVEISPDLIISDVMMPKLDGFGLLQKVRSDLSTKNIPLIFLSARAGEESRVEGLQSGADDYLVKPFSARELVARVGYQIAMNRTRRAMEKEFFKLFLQLPAHVHVFKGPEHLVEFFHPLGKRFIGRDITGQKIREAIPEFEGQGYFELLDKVFQTGETVAMPASKATLPNENGEPRDFYFDISYLPWRDANGKIQGVLQFTIDVTEKTKVGLAIKDSEERFRILANSIPQFVWIADRDGQVEFMSDRWAYYTGTSPEDGKKLFSSFIHPDDVGEVRQKWSESLQNKIAWTSEFRLRNLKINEYRWFFGHTVPLKDNRGNILKWIGSASDIQPQKELSFELEGLVAERTSELVKLNNVLTQKNEDLARAQNFLQTVLNSSVELVTAFDNELNYTFVNSRLRSIFNRNPEDLIGKNLLQVEPGFEKTDDYQHLKRALSGEVVHLEVRRSHLDKSLVFETFIIPLKHHGQITGVVTMQRDITAIVSLSEDLKKSNEQLMRSNEDLQQFAHVTSHDLKEPVRKIKMYGNMLLSDYASYLPEKGKEYLTRIEKATGRILSMIDGVLQYSTIEVSDQLLQDIDLMSTMKNIVEDLEVPVREQNAEIAFCDLPVIKGYSTLIYQLFYNLINNSIKFRRKDVAPVITIRYLPTFDEQEINANYFKIQIEDNGVGFDQAYAERIFESFTRLHPKDKFEGTGLGLALCRKIVLRHSGIIKAEGRLNQGARFNIYLPKAILQNNSK